MSAVAEYAAPLAVDDRDGAIERWFRLLGPLVIVACAVVAYANCFEAPFVFDGLNYLKEGQAIRELFPLGKLLRHVKTRPIGYLTFALNYHFDEYGLVSWHLTNLTIHILAGCAVFGIARRTFLSPRLNARYGHVAARLGLAIAVVWVVHPLCTQSVTYLYQRLESLMGMFYLGGLYAFVRYATTSNPWWAAASLASCLLAMATKEVAVTAPVMILWYDRTFWAPNWDELFRRRAAYYLLLLATLALPAVLIGEMVGPEYEAAGILDTQRVSVWDYARTQPAVVQHYLRLAIVPWGQVLDYAWPIAADDWRVYGPSMAFIVGLGVLTLVGLRAAPSWAFLGAWWFVILAPTSSIAPIIDLAFEHRTYLSLIGVVALVVMLGYEGIGWLVRRCGGGEAIAGAWRWALVLLLVAAYTTLTLRRNEDYRSEFSIWRDVRFKVPHNPRGHYNYGVYLQINGSPELVEEAIREYQETIRLDPNYADAYLNLGNLSAWKENPAEAETYFRHVIRIRPDKVEALIGLGDALLRLNRAAEARPYIERALELDPDNRDAQLTLDRIQKELTAPPAGAVRP